MKFPWLQNENSAASHPLLKVCKQSYLDNQITDWSAKVYCTPRQTHMLLLVGFTVPSGYNNRRGVKAWQVLYKRVAFTAFVVPDSFISTDVLNNCSASTVYNQGQSLSFFSFYSVNFIKNMKQSPTLSAKPWILPQKWCQSLHILQKGELQNLTIISGRIYWTYKDMKTIT